MAVATYEDVAVAIRRPISDQDEQAQVTYWLNGIELFIKARLGDVSALDQPALLYVETEAVAAKVRRHGTAESSITVAVDDGSVTRRYDSPVGMDDITDDWWNLLSPLSDGPTGSIRPSFDVDTVRWPVSTPPFCGGGFWS